MDLEDVMKVIVGKELEISTDVISGQLCMEGAENQKSVVVDISSEGSCVWLRYRISLEEVPKVLSHLRQNESNSECA